MKASERISEIYGELEEAINDKRLAEGQHRVDQSSPQALFALLRAVIEYLDEQVQ